MRQQQLKGLLFDTDGYFDNTNLKPNSLETLYFSAGAKSSDFWLNGVVINTNYEGDANAIYIGAGNLIHMKISIELGSTWEISTPFL